SKFVRSVARSDILLHFAVSLWQQLCLLKFALHLHPEPGLKQQLWKLGVLERLVSTEIANLSDNLFRLFQVAILNVRLLNEILERNLVSNELGRDLCILK